MKTKKNDLGVSLRSNRGSAIPIIEEQVTVGKEIVETGRLTIAKVVTNTEEIVKSTGIEEAVTVVRIPKNEYIDTPPVTRQEGDTTIIPVIKEVVVVEKRLLLIEELHITKSRRETEDELAITLRKETVTVTRSDAA